MKARTNNKVIISCAITGSIHTPTMSDALPITPAQISDQALAAAKAGAAIVHLHARDPKDGRPTRDPDVYLQFLNCIKQQCDAVLHITTGGGLTMTIGDRLWAALAGEAERGFANIGAVDFWMF